MNHAARQPLYRQIEADRNTRIIAMVNGERIGLQTGIAVDAVRPMVSLLDDIGPVPKLSLILDTNGGSTAAAWRIINIIRSFCDELEVLVFSKAMSAGTLMSLGADRIVMTKQAALGPIDPSLDNHPLAPMVMVNGQNVPWPVSAEAVRGYIAEVKKDVSDPAALASVWNHLADKIHPIVLGDIFRLGEQIRSLASDLIKNQVKDEGSQQRIIQLLASESGSHDYTINRRKAEEIGLTVEKPSAALYQILNDIGKSYTAELRTLEPHSPASLLAGQPSVRYTLVRGLIESADSSFGYANDGAYTVDPHGNILDQPAFEGWRKLPGCKPLTRVAFIAPPPQRRDTPRILRAMPHPGQ